MIKIAKKKAWEDFHLELGPQTNVSTVWKKVKFLSNKNNKTQLKADIFGESKQLSSLFIDENFPSVGINSSNQVLMATANKTRITFSLEELNSTLKSKKNTSPGIDKISYKIINNINDNNKVEIVKLINEAWKNHTFPESFGKIKIIPIEKKSKNTFDTKNFRPIALIPNITKTINSMVKSKLESYLKTRI